MKAPNIALLIIISVICFLFGCQSDSTRNPFDVSEEDGPFYLDIRLPDIRIDAFLESKKVAPEIDIYLKTSIDSVGKKSFTLSVNKQIVSFDEFNDRFDSLRFTIEEPSRIRTVANLYIDKSAPFYLVDYLHKRLCAFNQQRVSYSNKMGQHFLHRLPVAEQQLWSGKRSYSIDYVRQPLPPPPPPLPSRNPESDSIIFSKKYLTTLKAFGIDQKPIPHLGSDYYDYHINPKNILEINLNADNRLSIKDKSVSLDETLQTWQAFMSNETLWRKKITCLVISGEADYGHFFEVYSTVLSAFQRKRNQLAVDMYGQSMSELELAEKKAVYNKLPQIIIPDLGD